MATRSLATGSTPQQLFFSTRAQRVALARQQFFEEDRRPSGLVSEAVVQSWIRCRDAKADARGVVTFAEVSASRLHSTLARSRQLLDASRHELERMEATLAGTGCRVLLTDADGVIVHATQNSLAAQEPIMTSTARVGVNIAESVAGTTAPGIVAKTGHACTVSGAEHYYDLLQHFQCAAAPIRDVRGRLAAVLDLSIESRAFGFDAASMIGLYATSIENRLLQTQSTDHLVLRFQADPSLLETPLAALAGVDADGRVAWLNGVAERLLNQPRGALPLDTQDVFGLGLPQLLRYLRSPEAEVVRLPSGLGVWLKAHTTARDGVDFNRAISVSGPHGPALASYETRAESEPPVNADDAPDLADATLGGHSRKLIEQTLERSGGNISKAARTLGVSRGMLYRRLRWSGDAGVKEQSMS